MSLSELYVRQIVDPVYIMLPPDEAMRKDFNVYIGKRLKNVYGNKCYGKGYIKRESIKILNIGEGEKRGSHLTGNITYPVIFEALYCIPQNDKIVSARVDKNNDFGLHAVLQPLSIWIPRQVQTKYGYMEIFQNTKIGDFIPIKIKGYKIEGDTLNVIGIYSPETSESLYERISQLYRPFDMDYVPRTFNIQYGSNKPKLINDSKYNIVENLIEKYQMLTENEKKEIKKYNTVFTIDNLTQINETRDNLIHAEIQKFCDITSEYKYLTVTSDTDTTDNSEEEEEKENIKDEIEEYIAFLKQYKDIIPSMKKGESLVVKAKYGINYKCSLSLIKYINQFFDNIYVCKPYPTEFTNLVTYIVFKSLKEQITTDEMTTFSLTVQRVGQLLKNEATIYIHDIFIEPSEEENDDIFISFYNFIIEKFISDMNNGFNILVDIEEEKMEELGVQLKRNNEIVNLYDKIFLFSSKNI